MTPYPHVMFGGLRGGARRGLSKSAFVVGAATTVQQTGADRADLVRGVFEKALADSCLRRSDVDGFVAVPALADQRFLEAHYQATSLGLFDAAVRSTKPLLCRTVDTCGAGPVTALLEARRMIEHEGLEVVAVVAGDCAGSMKSSEFLARADKTARGPTGPGLPSPAIVNGYERFTEYEINQRGTITRDHLRLALILESYHASRHPESLFYRRRGDRPYDLGDVREAAAVTANISIKECAWRADGAGCIIIASDRVAANDDDDRLLIAGGGEASGSLYPAENIDEQSFSTGRAVRSAYGEAGLGPSDIDFFGLYDCFPICLVRAIEAAGLCGEGTVGDYLERQYDRMLAGDTDDPRYFPVNTHGGLLCFGAPFAVPAIYNIAEAVHQLRSRAKGRQIPNARRALVYGNGGVLSSSAVAILEASRARPRADSHHGITKC